MVDATPGQLTVQAVICQIFSDAEVSCKISSHRLVRKNEGVKMRNDGGAVFSVRLPRAASAGPQPRSGAAQPA